MTRSILLVASLLVVAPGCVYSARSFPRGPFPPVALQQTRIYAGDAPDGGYDVIGAMTVDVGGDGEAALAELRAQASAAGADAVVHVRLTQFAGASSRTGLTGVAVRRRAATKQN